MTTRQTAQQKLERIPVTVLEVDVDTCSQTFGVLPCTASGSAGSECYNTYSTCLAPNKVGFTRTTVTKKFISRGQVVPGETVRPYISGSFAQTPTEIVPSKGLAMRSQTSVKLLDEPCPDHLEDKYAATRATPAGGTFWTRMLARNPNLVGRVARLRQGYVTTPWDWSVFQTQTFVVDAVRGPDDAGAVTLVLSDVLKIADNNMVPVATDGTLTADCLALANSGAAQGGGTNTITLSTAASSVDGSYVGMEVYVASGTGAGQRRVVSAFVGASRVATVTVAWSVQPTSSSNYEISPLSINLGAGKGAKYTDPATSGKFEYVRIGDEVIRYTALSGDVLSWPDATYRAQFGTSRTDHKAGDAVQLCRAWFSKRPWEVLRDILAESGISTSYLDLTNWQTEDTNWFNGAEITTVISAPGKASDLAAELLRDINAMAWYDPVAALVKMLANQPIVTGTPTVLTEDNLISQQTQVERQDADRITRAAIYYGLRSATGNVKESKSYQAASLVIDVDAESANEYAAVRADTTYSRWLGAANNIYAGSLVARRVSRLRNAPTKVTLQLDPKDEVQLGSLVTVSTRRLVASNGQQKPTLCRVVKYQDRGTHFEIGLLTTDFRSSRYGVIAPTGYPDYGSASTAQRFYGFICNTATGRMTNGDAGYCIA